MQNTDFFSQNTESFFMGCTGLHQVNLAYLRDGGRGGGGGIMKESFSIY